MNGAQQMPDLSTWLTDAEAAGRLGVHPKTLARDRQLHPMHRPVPGRRAERVWNPEEIQAKLPASPPRSMEVQTVGTSVSELSELPERPATLVGALAGTLARLAGVVESCMEAPASPALWLTIPEASQYTGLSETFLRRITRDGRLRSVRDGAIKVRREDLDLVHLAVWP